MENNNSDFSFVKNYVQKINVEPNMESPIDAMAAERRKQSATVVSAAPPASTPPSKQEFVEVNGYKLPKDFFTCITTALIAMKNKKVNKILDAFGFAMKDVEGKQIYPPLKKKRRK